MSSQNEGNVASENVEHHFKGQRRREYVVFAIVFPLNLDELDHDLTVMSLEWLVRGSSPKWFYFSYLVAGEIEPPPPKKHPWNPGFFRGGIYTFGSI